MKIHHGCKALFLRPVLCKDAPFCIRARFKNQGGKIGPFRPRAYLSSLEKWMESKLAIIREEAIFVMPCYSEDVSKVMLQVWLSQA